MVKKCLILIVIATNGHAMVLNKVRQVTFVNLQQHLTSSGKFYLFHSRIYCVPFIS